jgi:hypothetical protein
MPTDQFAEGVRVAGDVPGQQLPVVLVVVERGGRVTTPARTVDAVTSVAICRSRRTAPGRCAVTGW